MLTVEIADEIEEQMQGLMYRESLPEDHSMLFAYPAEAQLIFWMKNTFIPLDILYFDKDGRFVSSAQMTPCERDPCTKYPSNGEAMYALEVHAGFVEENGVGEGWTLQRSRK